MTLTDRETPWGKEDITLWHCLSISAETNPAHVFARTKENSLTVSELARRTHKLANALEDLGVKRGDRVAVMMTNSFDHIVVFFALMKIGACLVPTNIHLRDDGLRYILSHSRAETLISESHLREHVEPIAPETRISRYLWRNNTCEDECLEAAIDYHDASVRPSSTQCDDVVMISFTSGTTGRPKGVLMTDRMMRITGNGAARLSDCKPNDVFHCWEPLYHIGGSELLVLAAMTPITLAMVDRFSVSKFWHEVRFFEATHIHFLGGVLALLLKAPPREDDKQHSVRVAWGGGCPQNVWRAFEDRFGVPIHECYGMTECSSFASQNLGRRHGSVGKPLPWIGLEIVDEDGLPVPNGTTGEIVIREKVPGALLSGYLDDADATAAVLKNGAVHSGDLGHFDDEGYLYYDGRKKDSIRRRGENISAFEIEHIVNQHPDVEECAAMGIENDMSDEDVLIYLRLKAGRALDPTDFIKWAETRMAYFQVPRFVGFMDSFSKTPTQRIRKELLSRDKTKLFDLEASGYKLRRD